MLLSGKKGLILNVTNEYSIGWNIALAATEQGATVGIGAQTERIVQKVERLVAEKPQTAACKVHQVDFQSDDDMNRLAETVASQYGKLDFLVHAAAFAKKEELAGRFIETSREGFNLALEVSAYSFVHLCQVLEPHMNDDSSILTLSYLGAVRATANYNIMGVAKAALESATRYLSADLGKRGIRVNALSPGPIKTAAAMGVSGLQALIDHVEMRAPLKRPYSHEVGGSAVWLMSELSKGVSGQTIYVDSGYSIVGA